MKNILRFGTSVLLCSSLSAWAENPASSGNFKATLTGYEELLPVSTKAIGEITASVDAAAAKSTITLKYFDLGSAPTTAQLHWGQEGVSGPAILTICGGTSGNVCPTNEAAATTFTFTAQALQAVIATAGGNLTGSFPAASLEAFTDALRGGVVYENIHTQSLPYGEIRGQLWRGMEGRQNGNPGHGH